MFVRSLIARHYIPEQAGERIPAARIDLDLINRSVLAQQPWLMLLLLATQLRPQLPGSPFATLLGPEEFALANLLRNRAGLLQDEDRSAMLQTAVMRQRQIEDMFANGLQDSRVVIIFDTLEELSLHQPIVLGGLLTLFDRMRRRCRGLHLLLSGRYPLFDSNRPIPELAPAVKKRLESAMEPLLVEEFSDEESRQYLRDLRYVPAQTPVDAIVKKAAGNPFGLALFADLALSRPLSVEDVEKASIKFAYLIERIIDRIPDEDESSQDPPDEIERKRTQRAVRWLLRYAVIPRQLTKDFMLQVLAPFLLDEITGKTERDNVDDLSLAGPVYENTPRWRRLKAELKESVPQPIPPLNLDKVWSALENYASAASWVSGTGDLLQLQPEVVVPMRELLRANPDKYPIYSELHQAAARYFEDLANPNVDRIDEYLATQIGEHLSEALYHRFQDQGRLAAPYWDRYREQCRQKGPAAVKILAENMLGKDYVDDTRAPVEHFRTGIIATTKILAEAALEASMAALLQVLRRPDIKQQDLESTTKQRLADYDFFSQDQAPVTPQVSVRVQLLEVACGLFFPDNRRLDPSVWSDTATLPHVEEQIAARLLRIRYLGSSDAGASAREYNAALESAASRHPPAFPDYFIRGLHGRFLLGQGRLEEACVELERAVKEAMDRKATPTETSELLLRFSDLGYAIGQWARVRRMAETMVSDPARFPYPAHEEANGWLIRLALDRFDYTDAQRLVYGFQTHMSAVKQEFSADVAAACFMFDEAEENYRLARQNYESSRFVSASFQVRLKHARFILDQVGAPKRSSRLLDAMARTRVFPEPIIQFEFYLLRIRQLAAIGAADEATTIYQTTLDWLTTQRELPTSNRALTTATLLAEGLGDTQHALAFVSELAGVQPVSARCAILSPFLLAPVDSVSTARVDLLSALGSAEETPDSLRQNLCLAAALIFFQDIQNARRLLQELRQQHSAEPDLLLQILRLAGRISPDAMDIEPPDNWISYWENENSQNPCYAGVALLEEAERAFAKGRHELRSGTIIQIGRPVSCRSPGGVRLDASLARAAGPVAPHDW